MKFQWCSLLGIATIIAVTAVISLYGNYWEIPVWLRLIAGFLAGNIIGRLDRARAARLTQKP